MVTQAVTGMCPARGQARGSPLPARGAHGWSLGKEECWSVLGGAGTPARSPRKPGADGALAPASGCTGAPAGLRAVTAWAQPGCPRNSLQRDSESPGGRGQGLRVLTPLSRKLDPGDRRVGLGHHGNSPLTGY